LSIKDAIRTYVFDSSVALAIISNERGGAKFADFASSAFVSTLTYIEVISKLVDRGLAEGMINQTLGDLNLAIVDLDESQAAYAGFLRTKPRAKGLSLGDRACLALAHATGRTALTADRAWADLDVGVPIELIR
jgi:ribonuclease VapC